MFRILLTLTLIFGPTIAVFTLSDSPIVAFAAILLAAPVVLVGVKVGVERGN